MNNLRISRVIEKMRKDHIDQLLLNDPNAIFYLTDEWIYPGERLHILSISAKGEVKYFVNKLFTVKNTDNIEVVYLDDIDDQINILCKSIFGRIIGVDKKFEAKFLLPIMNLADDADFVEGSYIIDDLRAVKDLDEIEKMINASKINDATMDKIKNKLSSHITEKEMASYLMQTYKSYGASGFSFDPIIAYGDNATDPHHETDDSLLKPGESVVVDIGCIKDNYCSDMTRTFFYKEVSEENRKIYNIVKEANEKAISIIKPGIKLSDIDKAAREVIEEAGFGKYFTHRTGHFIGLETHETGDVSSVNDNIVSTGNIFSIEPGIYIPGKIGVRIEDLVLVTEEGVKVLNNYTKDLQIIE